MPGWAVSCILFALGVIPFTLLGGWGEAGDTSIWPWTAGFGTQAGFVLGYVVTMRMIQRRRAAATSE